MFDRNKKSLTELIIIHAAAVVDEKLKGQVWDDAITAQRDTFENLSHLDAVTLNSEATLQRIRATKHAYDAAWKSYRDARNYLRKIKKAIGLEE